LIINTGTTIVTFLMVFLIQNTQNLDSEALQVKLDELIRAIEEAHNGLLDLEQRTRRHPRPIPAAGRTVPGESPERCQRYGLADG